MNKKQEFLMSCRLSDFDGAANLLDKIREIKDRYSPEYDDIDYKLNLKDIKYPVVEIWGTKKI